jgi:glycine/D-amino acid oxidase-like deaminating enzyme/nitrite reductase/ring-hydroxylating ferredoxin subunit
VNETTQASHSLWQEIKAPPLRSLHKHFTTDVCIVGAGISGLTTAYLLLRNGFKVAVLDKREFGLDETGFTTAHLSNALDDTYTQLIKWHGEKGAALAYESHTDAIDLIEKIMKEEKIDCDFKRVNGYLFLAPGHKTERLKEELESAHKVGFTKVQSLLKVPSNSFNSGPCLLYPEQAQLHPLKYLKGLVQAIQRLGGQIFTGTQVDEIHGGKKAFVKTDTGIQVNCSSIVVATNVPVNQRFTIYTKEAQYRSYVLGIKVPKNFMEPALLWDTKDPYHYVRFHEQEDSDYDIMIVGGEDHKTGQGENPEIHFSRLKSWLKANFNIAEPEVVYHWSGQIVEPIDGLAYIGRSPMDDKNVFIATGDSGHGMTHGTIAGILLRDLIIGRKNEWEELYDPKRLNYKSLGNFVKENFNTASQYMDWISPGDSETFTSMGVDEGMIVRHGFSKIAVYRDEHGSYHFHSAVCPHLGGIVHWNSAEKTWDCPCHGSRFSKNGEAINGPSNVGLSPARH